MVQLHTMSWIDRILDVIFPPPVSLRTFDLLPPPSAHTYESWIFSATRYQSQARAIVRYLKETPDKVYSNRCARMMAKTLEAWLLEHGSFTPQSSRVCIVPVPQHKSTTKDRGFSQSILLAHEMTTLLPYTLVKNILKKHKKTEKQALLSKTK